MPPTAESPPRRLRSGLALLAGEGVRMLLLSLSSLILGYVLTTVQVEVFGADAKAAYGVALVICSVLNFFGCRYFVFRGARAPLWQEALKFFPSVFAFRAFEVVLFSILVSVVPSYHVAYFATAAISMLGKLLVSKLLIFRRPQP